ncbi:helix-turn-helix domain-containing protein [Eremococcus coleocola]|uniref:HTH cro/C1-type domain-containing protein n=1 Tax=Eremococcus coleocola ACS-139-V-Col8 TaxID=908337 RepID=E4KQK9_9LACT|nr:helix-turn-helix transcriptional regulator [Eremococcus coleocola]EFR30817.1 hypothetical protein HMPREF9257_0567 [Eremococcus coleocola ACS-139-V-Col8]
MVVFDDKLDLAQWRGVKKMTKAELSRLSGISTRTIADFEDCPQKMLQANYSTLVALSKALEINVSDFKNF